MIVVFDKRQVAAYRSMPPQLTRTKIAPVNNAKSTAKQGDIPWQLSSSPDTTPEHFIRDRSILGPELIVINGVLHWVTGLFTPRVELQPYYGRNW